MGIQQNCWESAEKQMRLKNVFGILQRPMAYVVTSVFLIACLFAFQHAFAQEGGNSAILTASAVSPSKNNASSARLGTVTKESIEEFVSRVTRLNEEKLQLDNAWRIERNKYDAMKIRIDDSKKTIRSEMDEVLVNNSPRERLDELLIQHERLSKDEKEVAKQVTELEEKLSAHQLLLIQANRDLERMRTLYAAQQREQDIQRVQEISRFLDRDLRFNESLSFKCSTTKSIAACLNDYPLDSRIESWVQEHYQAALANDLTGKVEQMSLSSDWYSAQINRNFVEASMSLDGSVVAEVEIRANIVSRKMMACSLLKAPADLCNTQSTSLIVRSNKYGDKVYINNKPYGSTPLSVMLDPGIYNVQVKYKELTQKRTLTLDENRQLNFVF